MRATTYTTSASHFSEFCQCHEAERLGLHREMQSDPPLPKIIAEIERLRSELSSLRAELKRKEADDETIHQNMIKDCNERLVELKATFRAEHAKELAEVKESLASALAASEQQVERLREALGKSREAMTVSINSESIAVLENAIDAIEAALSPTEPRK